MNLNPVDYFEKHKTIFNMLNIDEIITAVDLINHTSLSGGTIFTCGNGGSATTASHMVTDWNKMVFTHTNRQFKGICLCDNVGLLTAYANDLSYDDVFVGQLNSLYKEGDLLLTVSGSGNSPNTIKATNFANENGMKTLSIVGFDGGLLKKISQHCVHVPSFDMQICEDIHLMFNHIVMKDLCGLDIKN